MCIFNTLVVEKTENVMGFKEAFRVVNCFKTNKHGEYIEIQIQIDKATILDRVMLLQSTKVKAPLDLVPLIVTYLQEHSQQTSTHP